MAMRHGLNLEEGEGAVEVLDYVNDEGEDGNHYQQQPGSHNVQQRRNSMLVEESRRSSFLEEQVLSSELISQFLICR